MQPLNPNSLFECVRLGKCTPSNVTNSALYRNGRLLVDHDAETEDCTKYHVHGSGENLPQSPICHSPLLAWEIEKPRKFSECPSFALNPSDDMTS